MENERLEKLAKNARPNKWVWDEQGLSFDFLDKKFCFPLDEKDQLDKDLKSVLR